MRPRRLGSGTSRQVVKRTSATGSPSSSDCQKGPWVSDMLGCAFVHRASTGGVSPDGHWLCYADADEKGHAHARCLHRAGLMLDVRLRLTASSCCLRARGLARDKLGPAHVLPPTARRRWLAAAHWKSTHPVQYAFRIPAERGGRSGQSSQLSDGCSSGSR